MGTYTTNKSLYKPAYKEVQYHTLVNGNFDTIDDEVLWLEYANSNTCSVAGGTSFIRLSGLQVDGVAMTGTLRGAYIDVSNGSTAATGTIRAMELKARTEAPGDTGNDVAVLEGLSISADSKGHSVTTVMRAAEFICDGAAGGTIAEMVGLRLANNLQANKATKSFGLEIYKDSFQSTADIRIFEVGGGGNYIGFLGPSSIAADVVWTLPNVDGSANQVIETDGSGALSWVTVVLADGTVGLSADWDVGAHGFRAQTLTADALTAGRVIFAGTNGLLSDDAGLVWNSTNNNLGIVATSWGTNAVGSFAIANGTAPTSSIANQIEIFSTDISGNDATLGLRTEAAVAADADETKFSNKLPVKINGADYFIMLTVT